MSLSRRAACVAVRVAARTPAAEDWLNCSCRLARKTSGLAGSAIEVVPWLKVDGVLLVACVGDVGLVVPCEVPKDRDGGAFASRSLPELL